MNSNFPLNPEGNTSSVNLSENTLKAIEKQIHDQTGSILSLKILPELNSQDLQSNSLENQNIEYDNKITLELNKKETNFFKQETEDETVQEEYFNPEKICRLCTGTAQPMVFIYGDEGKEFNLESKINGVIPNHVNIKDYLPKQICNSCFKELQTSKSSGVAWKDAESVLKIYLNNGKFLSILNSQNTTFTTNDNSDTESEGNLEIYHCPLCTEGFMHSMPEPPQCSIPEKRKRGRPKGILKKKDISKKEINENYKGQDSVKVNRDGTIQVLHDRHHECRFCGVTLYNEWITIFSHSLKHIDESVMFYPCCLCYLSSQNKEELNFHIRKNHFEPLAPYKSIKPDPQLSYYCSVCNRHFKSQNELLNHTCNPMICKKCNITFYSMQRFEFHQHLHKKGEISLICENCSQEFLDEETLYHHNRFAHENKSIKCNICDKELSCNSGLRNHMKTHINERRYPCIHCDKRFINRQTLREHLVVHLDSKPFQCKVCNKNFARQSRLRLHMLSHEIASQKNPQPLYSCNKCGQVFPKHELITNHWNGLESGSSKTCILQSDLQKNNYTFNIEQFLFIYRCEYCEKSFKNRTFLNNHRKNHTELKPFRCHICHATFESFSRCTTHKVTHGLFGLKSKSCTQVILENNITNLFTIPRLFACPDCDKDYPHWSYLSVHRKITHCKKLTKFICKHPGCTEEFTNSWSLSYHRKTKHPYNKELNSTSSERNKPYKCDICGRYYLNLENLKHHLNICHSEETDHSLQCDECGKVFSHKTILQAHRRMHNGIKAFACTICPKRFVHATGLNMHLRMHRGEKPHVCPYCGKSFLQRSDKEDHVRKHTGERPFACKDCPKRFRTRAMWLEHTRIHNDERPFPCDICGAAFRRSFALKNHRLIHTGDRPFVCDLCGKNFRLRQDLIKHQRATHKTNKSLKEINPIDQKISTLDNNSLNKTGCVCRLCDQEFLNTNDLHLHIHNYHEDIYLDENPLRFEDSKVIEINKMK